jgi:hypothetical protein
VEKQPELMENAYQLGAKLAATNWTITKRSKTLDKLNVVVAFVENESRSIPFLSLRNLDNTRSRISVDRKVSRRIRHTV